MLSDVIGQPEGVAYLQRMVDGYIQSPLLLLGDEGVGRKFSAICAIKQMVSNQRGVNHSDVHQVERGAHPDVVIVTAPSDKELGVDPIREVVGQSMSYPTAAPCRFFVIDGADRLTTAAANALLKTLEEPPAASRFLLIAESYDRVLPTIRSRCGRVPFRRLPEAFLVERLSKFESDSEKALVYARMGEGSIGRAARFWGSNRLTLRDSVFAMLQSAAGGDVPYAFSTIDELTKELPLALRFLCFLVHDVLAFKVEPERVINQDILDDVGQLRARLKPEVWSKVWENLKTVSARYESSYVNLPFQLKSAFAQSFGA